MALDHSEKEACVLRLLALVGRPEYQVGARIPGEQELVRHLHASRHLVRLALGRLERMGLIERRRRSGSYVRRRPADDEPFGEPVSEPATSSRTISLMAMSPRVTEEMAALQQQALAEGYLLHFYLSHMHGQRIEDERQYLELAVRNRYRGVVIHAAPRFDGDDPIFERVARRLRLAHLGLHGPELPGQSFFVPDYALAGAAAAARLVGSGCRSLRLATSLPEDHHVTELIGCGVRLAAAGGVAVFPSCVPDAPGGARRLELLAALPPDAGLVVFSPLVAQELAARIAARGAGPRMVLIEDDLAPAPCPALAFDWLRRARDAVAWVTGEDRTPRHRLYSPEWVA